VVSQRDAWNFQQRKLIVMMGEDGDEVNDTEEKRGGKGAERGDADRLLRDEKRI
jgi:hypothetical protein